MRQVDYLDEAAIHCDGVSGQWPLGGGTKLREEICANPLNRDDSSSRKRKRPERKPANRDQYCEEFDTYSGEEQANGWFDAGPSHALQWVLFSGL